VWDKFDAYFQSMKYFLVSVNENVNEPEAALRKLNGISDVEMVSSDEFDFSKISVIGPALSEEAQEKLAEEMNLDTDIVNKAEAEAYLKKLRETRTK
jgi:hypothetical protein